MITKGSLCSGYGGLDALLPGRLAFVAETDAAASAILAREHPEAPNLGDITTDAGKFPYVNLLTSGDPCQSMSESGRKLASDDSRFLWPDVMNVIDHVKPDEIFLENVRYLTTVPIIKDAERGSVLKMRLDNLREAGYAARWTVLGACTVGAPHHRHRWFLRAIRSGGTPEAEQVISRCGVPRSANYALLPSPRHSDGKRGAEGNRKGRTHTGGTLLDAVTYGGPWDEAIQRWVLMTGQLAPETTEPSPRGGWRLAPEFSEWMMGLEPGLITKGVDRSTALALAGNGVVPRQAKAAWDLLAPC